MDNLTNLHQILYNIEEVSTSIIKKSAKIFNQFLINKDRYSSFRKLCDNDELTEDEIDDYYNRAIKNYIDDSKRIKSELNTFVDTILNGKMNELSDDAFLSQVWSGDAYDNDKIQGLVDLYEDLHEQDKNFELSTIETHAFNLVNNE